MITSDRNPVEVLLIDDDEMSREVLTLLLSAQGYAVQAVDSGNAALDHLLRTQGKLPQAILTDLQMPGITGTELAQRLRAACGASGAVQLRLLAMSGSQPDEATRCSFDGFLLKPFTMQAFVGALASRPTGPAKTEVEDSAPPVASLDEDIYGKLASSMSREQLHQLYSLCLSDIEGRIARMQTAASGGDDASYRREAHAIKGGCGMVGALEIHALAGAMETKGLDAANHVASLDEMLLLCERLRVILVARQ